MLKINRRAALAGLATLAAPEAVFAQSAPAIPHSKGTEKPKLVLPANAIDCHIHFYHSKYPMISNAIRRSADAVLADYRLLQQRLGMSRVVIVTPSAYGTDNSSVIDGIKDIGLDKARGVAVLDTSVTDDEIKRLHGLGVRGIRFNLATPGTTTIDMVEPLAKRIAPFGWHQQFHMKADQIADAAAMFERLPVPAVFDHLGRLPMPGGMNHAAFKLVRVLMEKNKAYVKLSGLYMETKVGAPTYADTQEIAKAYFDAAPVRCVWGTDWPHPTEGPDHKPDDAHLLDALAAVDDTDAKKRQLFVTNAETLYDFPKAG